MTCDNIFPAVAWRWARETHYGLGDQIHTAPEPHTIAPKLTNIESKKDKPKPITFESNIPLPGKGLVAINIESETGEIVYTYISQQLLPPQPYILPLDVVRLSQKV